MIDTSPGHSRDKIIRGGEQHKDRMTPEDIEELFKRTDGVVAVVQQGSGGDEDDGEEPTLTADETSYRIARLKEVLNEAQSAWDSGSEDLDRIAEKLGDGSRRCEWHPAAFLLELPNLHAAALMKPICLFSATETKQFCTHIRIVTYVC